ncbi:MAG: GldG family protein [Spirochaetota bacterium]
MKDIRRKRESLLLALTLGALLLAGIASVIFYARFDLTTTKAFTLSETTKKLHLQLPERLRVTYFVSGNLADRHPGPAAIEDLLREIESRSRGKITVRIVDPKDDASEAESFGVAPQQMQIVERSEQRVALVYSGIAIEYLDRFETIPLVISVDTLEYDFVKAVRSLIASVTPKAGFMVGDDDKTVGVDYRTLAAAVQRSGYEIREVQRGSPVDPDITLLFVLGNAAMDRYDAWFVDQYLMAGGRVFFAAKGVDVNPEYGLQASAVPEGGLLGMLSSYGIELGRELVLDQANLTVPFQNQSSRGGMTIQYLRYPHWIVLDPRNANPDHLMTAKFAGLDLYWPSPIRLKPVQGVVYDELAKTSVHSWLQTRDFAAGPGDSALYALERDTTGGQYLVAVAATGSFKSAFKAGDEPQREGAEPLGPGLASSPETRLVVVSSADFLTELMRMSESTFNVSFALSAADWLSSGDDLIAIRSRLDADRRLNKIQDEATRSMLVFLTYFINLALIPLGVVLVGLLRSWKRSRLERRARGAEA